MRTELVNAKDQDGLVDLESEGLRLDKGKRLSVDLDNALTGLTNYCEYIVRMRARSWHCVCTLQWATAVGEIVSILFTLQQLGGGRGGRTSRGLLLAEALHALGSHVGRLWDVRAVRSVGVGFAVVTVVGEVVRQSKRIGTVGVRALGLPCKRLAPAVMSATPTRRTPPHRSKIAIDMHSYNTDSILSQAKFSVAV